MDLRNRRRLQALLIASIFIVPAVVALVMTSMGWVPQGRSYGDPVQPELDLTSVPLERADGQDWSWRNDDAVWTLVALPGPVCGEHCLRQLDLVSRARISLGRHADKLRLLYLGEPPEGVVAKGFEEVWTLATTTSHALEDMRARARDTVSAVLVTPDGKALTRYPADFDPAALQQDLKKVVH